MDEVLILMMEDDKVMWDIRYLLSGSKIEKLPGISVEMANIPKNCM